MEESQLTTCIHPFNSFNFKIYLPKDLCRHLGSTIKHWEGAISFWADFDGAILSLAPRRCRTYALDTFFFCIHLTCPCLKEF